MRVTKFLFCAACLCSAGVLAKTALTQERQPERAPPIETSRVRDESATAKTPGDSYPLPTTSEPAGLRGRAGLGGGGGGGGGFGGGGGGGGAVGGFSAMSGTTPEYPVRPRIVRRTVSETVFEPIPPEELEAQKTLQAAIQELTNGKDEETRKAAADTVQQQLTTQFEADLKQREKELAEVEQRVKSLREQLDKRKAAQADIINLRLQTLVNNANGLGFPDANLGTIGGNGFTRYFALPSEAPLYQPGTEYSADPGDRPLLRKRDPFDKPSDSSEKHR